MSNAGKKRGRGKGLGKITAKNLNRGQVIGIGKSNMVWPGLNAPILKGKEVVEMRQLPPDPDHEKKLIKLRDEMGGFRMLRLSSLERGWSGNKAPGRSIGPPDSIGEDTFEGFDTKVLEFKTVTNMSGTAGRKKRLSAFVLTGNRNGLAGYALAKAPEGKSALRKAKNRAAQRLMYIELFNGHTIFHNFYAKYGRTKVFVHKKPKGYGLVCHRALKTICEIIGIKDMYAKVEGNTKNIKNLTRAFFEGLLHQKTHQQLADETGLNVVEFRKETDFFPRVIASPRVIKTPQETTSAPPDALNYGEYVSEGRVALRKKRWPRFYIDSPGWQVHLKKTLFRRNHKKVRIQLLTEYGAIKSHLTDVPYDELPKIAGVGVSRGLKNAKAK